MAWKGIDNHNMRLYVLSSLAGLLASQPLIGQSPEIARPKAAALTAFSQSLEALAARVDPAVVQIISTSYGRGDEGQRAASLLTRQRSTGSGVILSADGYIATNNHVVQGARKIEVKLAAYGPGNLKETVMQAKLVGADRQTDLAVIKIDRTGLPQLNLGELKDVRVGQVVSVPDGCLNDRTPSRFFMGQGIRLGQQMQVLARQCSPHLTTLLSHACLHVSPAAEPAVPWGSEVRRDGYSPRRWFA